MKKIMQNYNLSFFSWFITNFLINVNKKGFSTIKVKKKLGIKKHKIEIKVNEKIQLVRKSNKETTIEVLGWIHLVISNAKTNFLRNLHKIKGKDITR